MCAVCVFERVEECVCECVAVCEEEWVSACVCVCVCVCVLAWRKAIEVGRQTRESSICQWPKNVILQKLIYYCFDSFASFRHKLL